MTRAGAPLLHLARRAALHAAWIVPVLGGAVLAGTCVGETAIAPATVLKVLANEMFGAAHPLDRIERGIVWNYRLTRAVLAACCGAALATAGVVLQALLRNALADPYLLGISAGASAGAVAVTVLGVGAGAVSLGAGALGGALLAFGIVSVLARVAGGGAEARGAAQVVLAGVAGSQLFNALTALLIARSASAEQARSISFWLLGSLSGARWDNVRLAVPVALVAVLGALWQARALDAMAFGAEAAAALGVPVRRLQAGLVLLVALATAAMVSIVGAIGFVGLVVPHATRMLVGPRHGRLLPCAAVAGAVFTVGADVASRVLVPGQVLPIGVVTALVGAPVFALILARGRPRGTGGA